MNPTYQTETHVRALSEQIEKLANRLLQNIKDAESRQSLNQLVSERKAHLKAIKEADMQRYVKLAQELGVRA